MRRFALVLAAAGICAAVAAGRPAAAAAGRRPDLVAIPASELARLNPLVAVSPKDTRLAGRVLLKDGVTPVGGAEISFSGAGGEEPRVARSSRSGEFTMKLPAGRYALRIARRMEVYEARAVYVVPPLGSVTIDFLLLPDFEKPPQAPSRAAAAPPRPRTAASGPDPRPAGPAVVGSVVDMMRASRPHHSMGRWSERLAFLASLLAVTLAAR